MPRKISIARAKARFAEFIRRAEAGETVVLTRHGRPVARLAPVAGLGERDTAGALQSEIRDPKPGYELSRREGTEREPPRSESGRREALARLLQESIWPRVPESVLGRGVAKQEREEILGYGGDGT
jgi:prevent-host-death family protein